MNRHPESTPLVVPVSQLDHILGPETAKVTLVEYGDFECPNCGQVYPAVKILHRHFGERMRFVFRHFPLREVHRHAEIAAEAAEAAGAQRKFWPMHDLLFENQLHLKSTNLRRYAEAAELDPERYDCEMGDHVYLQRVLGISTAGSRVECDRLHFLCQRRYPRCLVRA